MGRRSQLPKYQVFSAVDTTTDPESTPTDISSVDEITYEIEIDNTVDASLEVKFCNDSILSDTSIFKALDFNQATPLDGSTETSGLVHIENKGFKWMKLAVTDNGGTGDINAWITGTVKGA
jgi:hypothetical protein